jgi:hypothetical protein
VPPSGVPSSPPPGIQLPAGDNWFARGTTDSGGELTFTVPAGYAWCLREVDAPVNYSLDLTLHCTAVLTNDSTPDQSTIALPEVPATVVVSAHKFNAVAPNTAIAGATYELLVNGTAPVGTSEIAPKNVTVPEGDTYWGEATTDSAGDLSFSVPAGYAWCLHEVVVPAGYEQDPSYHCTQVISTNSPISATTIAVAETPSPVPPGRLAFTGGPSPWTPLGGAGSVALGVFLSWLGRRRRSERNGGPPPVPPTTQYAPD